MHARSQDRQGAEGRWKESRSWRLTPLSGDSLLTKVGDKSIPVTLDSGTTISILPKEIVPPEALTAKEIEAKCANKSKMMLQQAFLEMTINKKVIKRMGGVIAGSSIDW